MGLGFGSYIVKGVKKESGSGVEGLGLRGP